MSSKHYFILNISANMCGRDSVKGEMKHEPKNEPNCSLSYSSNVNIMTQIRKF